MPPRQDWNVIALLWLAGVGLRLTVLAVPPVIEAIRADLDLNGTQIGILSGLPVALFALIALPGALLIARHGALYTLALGLLVAGVASGLRGAVLNIWVLYAGTIIMGAGIAVMQPALPALVRQWLPERIGFGSAVYTNGLLVGETLPVALTVPLIFPLIGDSWRGGLAVWGLPLIAIAALVLLKAPRSTAPPPKVPPRWWPDWSDPLVWKLGFTVGSIMSLYFCSNAFLPSHLSASGRPELIEGALTALNFGQIPASLLLLTFATKVERHVWPFVGPAIIALASLAGVVVTASEWTILFSGLLGFILAIPFALGLALPALLMAPEDIARTAAAMFAIGYAWAMAISVISGVAWDLAGDVRFAFLPIALSTLPLIFLVPTIRMRPTAL